MARRRIVTDTKLADAQHEAAHVVVGVAVGLHFIEATIEPERAPDGATYLGSTWFYEGTRGQMALMSAAGIVWERKCGDLAHARVDLEQMREAGIKTNRELRAYELAAWSILSMRPGTHTRVTRALLDGRITDRSLRALFRPKS